MFPLDFPLGQLQLYPHARRVLDPFCGRGTTLYAARLGGRPAVGIDINPVAVAIARAKMVKVGPGAVVQLARKLLRTAEEPAPMGEFWHWCFHADTLKETTALRHGLRACGDTPAAAVLRAIMLGALHGPRNKGLPSYLSNQMPRSYASKPAYAVRYWRDRGLKPVRVNTLDVIERRVNYLLREARAGWMTRDIRPVRAPSAYRRQAEQFNVGQRAIGRAVDEIDVMAELLSARIWK
jgi:SAM-dependent methyltransferase